MDPEDPQIKNAYGPHRQPNNENGHPENINIETGQDKVNFEDGQDKINIKIEHDNLNIEDGPDKINIQVEKDQINIEHGHHQINIQGGQVTKVTFENVHDENVIKATLDELKHENFERFILQHEALGYKKGFLKIQPPPEFWTNVQLPDDIIIRDLNCPHSQKLMAPRTRRIVRTEDGRPTSLKFYLQCLAPSDKISLDEFKKRAAENQPSSIDSKNGEDEKNSKLFWTEAPSANPMYADEVEGSRCSLDSIYWSLPKLNTILQRVCTYLGIVLFGVTTPYLYYGQWLTRFCWHVEDLMLFSISYLHEGADKTWYVIPPAYRDQFTRLVRRLCRREYRLNGRPKVQSSGKDCDNFLHHKTFLLNPQDLHKVGIPFTEVVQKQGEIMITFPGAYHSGFNHGFNCAEALNFAMPSWLPFGLEAKICKHNKNAVKLTTDMERVAVYMEALFKEKIGQGGHPNYAQKSLPPPPTSLQPSSKIFAKKSVPVFPQRSIVSTTKKFCAKNSSDQQFVPNPKRPRPRPSRQRPRQPVSLLSSGVRINRIKLVRKDDNHYVIDGPSNSKNNLNDRQIDLQTKQFSTASNRLLSASSKNIGDDDDSTVVIQGSTGSTKILNCHPRILNMQDQLPALVSGADLISFGAGRYQCLRCGRIYNWKRNCVEHIIRIHKRQKLKPMVPQSKPPSAKPTPPRLKPPTPTSCPECGKMLSSRGVVNRHLVQVHFLQPLEKLSRQQPKRTVTVTGSDNGFQSPAVAEAPAEASSPREN